MKRRWSSKLVIVKNATQGLFVAETPEMHDLRQRRCPINQHRPNLQRRLHDHCLNRRHGFHHQIPVAFACGFEADSAKDRRQFRKFDNFLPRRPLAHSACRIPGAAPPWRIKSTLCDCSILDHGGEQSRSGGGEPGLQTHSIRRPAETRLNVRDGNKTSLT
jgi:hypothetical protein